jgi:hypothetical protein
MAFTRRGRLIAAVVTVVLLVGGAVFAVVALGAHGKTSVAQSPSSGGASSSPSAKPPPPPVCPLTGAKPANGVVPNRPALAVKVENIPESRPQTGLSWADIVYEEPVEGGITRFIAVYQCQNASRIEPVRSARLTDPDILMQFGHPLFGYSGAVPQVVGRVKARGLVDVNALKAVKEYHRDSNRLPPHNLYTSTAELYAAGHSTQAAPKAIFTYSRKPRKGAVKASEVHLPYSNSSDVFWKWSGSKRRWLRFHGTVPHLLSDGTQVAAVNVVVQVVKVVNTDITDVNGVPSPEVVATGTGKAYVFRNGKVIEGTWSRPALSNVTKFVTDGGKEIHLAAGNTWVELYPNTLPITIS